MNIKHLGLFATPQTIEELEAQLDRFSGGERAAAALMMGLTWNYLANQVNTRSEMNREGVKSGEGGDISPTGT